jgi:molybdopterin adenylyltransferase
LRVGIITISDRASTGARQDVSGPVLRDLIQSQGWNVVRMSVIPDNLQEIKKLLATWADSNEFDLLLTTGGTGFSPRDVTPEATAEIIQRDAPGLAEAMRAESLKITPHAMMSRARAGIRGSTLIVNLPGSPKAAVENFNVILPIVQHAVQLLSDDPDAEDGHRFDNTTRTR